MALQLDLLGGNLSTTKSSTDIGGNRAKAERLSAPLKEAIRSARVAGRSYRQLSTEFHADVDVVRVICRDVRPTES
jgi:hypothetical protein